jgi:ABC-type ATPase with predicted acetyltransferase domain
MSRRTKQMNEAQTQTDDAMSFPIQHPRPPVRSRRAANVAEMFGITRLLPKIGAPRAPLLTSAQLRLMLPAPGQIVLLTGPSGAGKSSILRGLRRMQRGTRTWVDLNQLRLPGSLALIDCIDDVDEDSDCDRACNEVMSSLNRVGLAEAWSYLRTPAELSEGQRWRLRLALVMRRLGRVDRANSNRLTTLVCDEFAAILDRVTACVVTRVLRNAIDRSGGRACAVVATSHDDLVRALRPDVVVTCDFVRVSVERLVRNEVARRSDPRCRFAFLSSTPA